MFDFLLSSAYLSYPVVAAYARNLVCHNQRQELKTSEEAYASNSSIRNLPLINHFDLLLI
jgi:hypothetical protein